MDILDIAWFFTGISMLGAFLNAKGDKRSFILWSISNMFFMYLDWKKNINAQAFLYCYFLLMNYIGYRSWSKK